MTSKYRSQIRRLSNYTLDNFADDINKLDKEEHEMSLDIRLEKAKMLAGAKKRCLEEGVTFKDWVIDNLKMTYNEATLLARIGKSQNPEKAMAEFRERKKENERKQRKHHEIKIDEYGHEYTHGHTLKKNNERYQYDTNENECGRGHIQYLNNEKNADYSEKRYEKAENEIYQSLYEFTDVDAQDCAIDLIVCLLKRFKLDLYDVEDFLNGEDIDLN